MYTFYIGQRHFKHMYNNPERATHTIYNLKHKSWHPNNNNMDTSNKGNQNCQYYQRSLW